MIRRRRLRHAAPGPAIRGGLDRQRIATDAGYSIRTRRFRVIVRADPEIGDQRRGRTWLGAPQRRVIVVCRAIRTMQRIGPRRALSNADRSSRTCREP